MKHRIVIKEVKNHTGQQVTIAGWVQTLRDQGNIKFLIIRDISGLTQAVVLKESQEAFEIARGLSLESVISLTGLVASEPQAPGGFEIKVESITILSKADPELPIHVMDKASNEAELTSRLDWRWIDLRKPQKQLIYRVWTEFEDAFRSYWNEHSYLQIHSPKLMSSPSESGAEVFEVKYFDRKAYLAQSPQFYKQMAMAAGFEKVYEIGPVFRAEPSFTTRHATEFTGYDAEISFIESHQEVAQSLEEAIIEVITAIKTKFGPKIAEFYEREVALPTKPFPQLTMKEAKDLLRSANVPSERADDLSPEEERRISKIIQEKYGHEFVFITEYPVDVRPFYHMRKEGEPTLTKSFDLLWNGIEIATGAQREHRYDILSQQAKEKGMSLDSLRHYLNFFKYGCPPHGGYGLGPERMLLKLFNLESIRDISYIYRGVKRLTP